MQKHVGRELKTLNNLLYRTIECESSKVGISLAQSRILFYIIKNSKDNPVFQKDIESEFNIRRSSATDHLQKLEKKGYIERIESSSDKRLKEIIATNLGIDVQKKTYDQVIEFERIMIQDIKESEMETFYQVIDKIKKNLEKNRGVMNDKDACKID